MKRYILALLLLTGCSATMEDIGSTTLQPLPTTGIPQETLPPTDTTLTTEQQAFLDDTYYFYQGTPPADNETLIEWGELWCTLMQDGMSAQDVAGRINEGASDNNDANMHYAIVFAAGQNLCQDQFNKIETMALAPYPPYTGPQP